MRIRPPASSVVSVFVLVVACVSATTTAKAATITVNAAGGFSNNGDCTLEEAFRAIGNQSAVDACAAGTGNDTIVFDPALAGVELDVADVPLTASGTLVVDGIDAPGMTIAFQQFGIVVQGDFTAQNVTFAHARTTSSTLISAQHNMALVNVVFSDDQIGDSILKSEFSDPSVTLTNVTITNCDTSGAPVIQLTEAQAVTLANVTVANVNAQALDLDATGPVVLTNVTLDHVDGGAFDPVAVIGRGPQITNLAVTNVSTGAADAVVVNADILHASSAVTMTIDACDAQTSCVHWQADGTVQFAHFNNVTAPFAFFVEPGGLDVTVNDTTITGSAGGMHVIHGGGEGGVHVDRLTQTGVGSPTRAQPTLLLETLGSLAQIDVKNVAITDNTVGPNALAVVELHGDGSATSSSLGQAAIDGCTGPAIVELTSGGIDSVEVDQVKITNATADHGLVLSPGGISSLQASRVRLEQNTTTGAQIENLGGVVTEAIVVGGNAVELDNANDTRTELRSSTIALADVGVTCTGTNNVLIYDDLIGPDVTSATTTCDLTGNGNLVGVDPLYTAPATASGDFTLQPGSPAINAGVNDVAHDVSAVDFANHPRVQGPAIDVGAFESPQASGEGEGEGEGSASEGEGEGAGEGEGEGAGEGEGSVGEGEGSVGEGEGALGEGEGSASEGEGEGEGVNGGGGKKNAAPPGCGCADSKPDALGVVVALALIVRRRRAIRRV